MTIKELKRTLESYPDDMQVVCGSDEELNNINGIGEAITIELEKQNNFGGFEALILCPNNQSYQNYYEDEI